ncbi:MAG: TRAP transporter small permease [Hyphomicrobium sp.]|nr:TRAP transporter small permease [Hyphomicrobium sp.]
MKALNRLEEGLIGFLMGAATLVIFVAVVQRYGLAHLGNLVRWTAEEGYGDLSSVLRAVYFWLIGIRLTWAQELCVFLFVWMAKFGAAYGVRTGIHVGVDLLVERLPPEWKRRTIILALLLGALFTGFVGWLGLRLVMHLWDTGAVSAVLEAPMWFVYLCVPLGSFLMCFRFLEVAQHYAATGMLPSHGVGIAHVRQEDAAP